MSSLFPRSISFNCSNSDTSKDPRQKSRHQRYSKKNGKTSNPAQKSHGRNYSNTTTQERKAA